MHKKNLKNYVLRCIPYGIMLVVILLGIGYQLRYRATVVGSDTMIHFQRFYDAMAQIKTGNYSYFQMNYGLYRTGRIFNAVYGPFFAYLNGLLLLICGTWYRFDIVSIVIVQMIGAVSMYKLSLKVKTDKWIALLLSLIYTESSFVVSFQRFNFMGWGGALAPLVIMQAVNMVQDHKKPIHWFQLALIMSILAQIHLWSTLMLTITIIPFAVYGLVKNNNKKQVVFSGLKAIGIAILLTANIWGAMLLLYHSNKLALPNVHSLSYFSLKIAYKYNYHAAVLWSIVLVIILQVIYILFHFKKNPLNTLSTGVAMFWLFAGSRLIPWARIQAKYPRLGSSLQFPYRFSIGAWPLIFMAIGITITYLNSKYGLKSKILAFLILLVLAGQNLAITIKYNRYFTNLYLNDRVVITNGDYYQMPKDRTQFRKILYETNSRKLLDLSLRAQPDYLPSNTSTTNAVFEQDVLKNIKHYKYKVKGDRLYVYWQSKSTKKRYLPIVMYRQSRLIVNGKDKTNVAKNKIYQPLVRSKVGNNTAILYFVVPTWFWILVWISLLSWVGMIIYGIKIRFSHNA